jgi:hypothetical protein
MSAQRLMELFPECFRAAGIFEREVPGASIVEIDVLPKTRDWVAIAAGITEREAAELFRGDSSRASRAQTPIRITLGGQLSALFVVRCFDPAQMPLPTLPLVTCFAPGRGIPFVEIRPGSYFRPSGFSGRQIVVDNFRWELDVSESQNDPIEGWLTQWKGFLGHNPAHPPSHLHMNTPIIDRTVGRRQRPDPTTSDLRLAVGLPNPLALILSFAGWLRAPA